MTSTFHPQNSVLTNNLSTVVACLCLWLVSSAISSGQDSDTITLASALQTQLDEITTNDNLPGATLAVVLKDGTTISLSSGFDDPDSETKLPVDAIMFCGSTGKTFVSAVALHLFGKGNFDLDDLAIDLLAKPDQQWFAKLLNAESISVRSLMNHTSGLPRYIFQQDFLKDIRANPRKSRSPRDNLKSLMDAEAVHEVGKQWQYSDTNYLVLGLIIEQLTQRSYYEVADEWLIKPLKLTNTKPSDGPNLPGLTQGHIGSNNLLGLPHKTVTDGKYAINPDFEWCGGGYVTCSRDLATWLHALHSGKALDASVYEMLIEPVSFQTGQPAETGYGLGTFVWKSKHGLFFGHAGIMPGYLTQIEYSKQHQFAIAFQTNTDEGMGANLHSHVQAIAETILKVQKNTDVK